jgi:hypothetical protein
MATKDVRLIYGIETNPDLEKMLSREDARTFAQLRGRPATKVEVRLSDSELLIDYGREIGEEIRVDLNSGRRVVVNHRKKELFVLDHGPSTFSTDHVDSSHPPAIMRNIHKTVRGGDKEIAVRRIDIDAGEFHVEGWATVGVERPASTSSLWAFMTGLPRLAQEQIGIPVELSIFSSADSSSPLVRVQLHEIDRDKDLKSIGYPNYRTVHEREGNGAGRSTRRSMRTSAAERAAGSRAGYMARLSPGDLIDPSRFLSMLGTGDDAAWITRQPTLNRLIILFNAFTGILGTIESNGQGIRFVIDWYGKLVSHLHFGSPAHTTAVLQEIWYLWLVYKALNGQQLSGLTAQEQSLYQVVTAVNDSDFLAKIVAIFHFKDSLPSSRFNELARSNFSDDIGGPISIDTQVTEKTFRDFTPGDVLRAKLWDFDTSLTFYDSGAITRMNYRNGKLHLVLGIKQIYVDFQFVTWPSGSGWSILAAIVSLGGTALLSSNYGSGYANVDDARLAFDIDAVSENGELKYRITVDETDSDMDSSAMVLGVNIAQTVLDMIGSAIVSWWNTFNDDLLSEVAKSVKKLANKVPLQFPRMWKARRHPPAFAAVGSESGTRVLRGRLIQRLPDQIGSLTTAVADYVDESGFGVSRQYLASWIRGIIPAFNTERMVDLDWEGNFGVALPDITTLPGPQLQFSGSWFTSEVGRYYRTRIERHAPIVTFPQQGMVHSAGDVELIFDVYLEAVVKIASTVLQSAGGIRFVGFDKIPAGSSEPAWRSAEARAQAIRSRSGSSETAVGRNNAGEARAPAFERNVPGDGAPGVPGVPGMPVIPDFGFDVPQSGIMFDPPHMEATTITTEQPLHTFIALRARVKGLLLLGFEPLGNLWLPEITIAMETQGTGTNTSLVLTDQLVSGSADTPFNAIGTDLLYAFVQPTCVSDAQSLLAELKADRSAPPVNSRMMIPDFVSATDEILNMVKFSQTATAADATDFTYWVDGDLLYWGITIDEQLSGHIS